MNFNKGKAVVVGVALLAAGSLVWAVAANGATAATPVAPANSVNGASVINGSLSGADLHPDVVKWFTAGPYNNTVTSDTVKDGSLSEADLNAALKTKVNASVVSVTALTALTNRPDSGDNGNWAKDTLTRTVSITRQAAVEASKCGASATTCWFYTGSLIDTGTFTTIDGAKSPGSSPAVTINGSLQGSVSGGTKLEFYASSSEPKPQLVQGSVDGSAYPTSEWVSQFFPASVVVTTAKQLDWSWTYTTTAPKTCEKWVNALAGNTGDIKGVVSPC